MKKLLWALAVMLFLLLVADLAGAIYLLDFALKPKRTATANRLDQYRQSNPKLAPWIDSVRAAGAWHDTTIDIDGRKLHAAYITAPAPTNRVAMLVHGYNDDGIAMLNVGHLYSSVMGYHIIFPDLHAHGQSEGDYIQMGWKDRLDVMRWMDVANDLFKGDSAMTQMVVHGVSMGAATVMAVAGETQKPYVKCYVEDCGYTSVYDEFRHELTDTALLPTPFPLPEFPLLPTASAWAKIRLGWSFKEASMIEAVKRCTLPMLFIHGDQDDFVPSWMAHTLYAAKPNPKEIYIGKGSGHARTLLDHQAEYASRVQDFTSKHIKNEQKSATSIKNR